MATIAMNPKLSPAPGKVREEPIGDSSWIAKIKYDPVQLQLTVTTKEGSEYVHFMVYPATVDQFLQSPSKGRFYSENIKGKGISTRTVSKNTGPQERNLARGPIQRRIGHGR